MSANPEIQELKEILYNDRRAHSAKLDEMMVGISKLAEAVTVANERDKMYQHRMDKMESELEDKDKAINAINVDMATLNGTVETNTEARKNTTIAIRAIGVSLLISFIVGGISLFKASGVS